MKVLLTSDVRKLGYLGDIVEVAEGYARNYLLPQGLAKPATDANIRSIAKEKAQRTEERKIERERMEQTAKAVDGAEAVIVAAANEQGHLFGAIHPKEVAENLRSQGFEVQDEAVELTHNIKEVGTHKVKLWFDDGLTATVMVTVVSSTAAAKAEEAGQPAEAQQPAEQAEQAEQPPPENPPA